MHPTFQETIDARSVANAQARRGYRFEMPTTNASEILEKINSEPIAGFKIFGTGEITIAGHRTAHAFASGHLSA